MRSLLAMVMPEVAGCPDPVARQALVRSARVFSRDTWCWRAVVFEDAVDEAGEITLEVPEGADLAGIVSVEADDEPADHSWLEGSALRVESNGDVVVVAALMPKMDATDLPEVLSGRYGEWIAEGAKARLMRMPGVEWSAPELGHYYEVGFYQGIEATRVHMARGGSAKPMKAKPRPFI